MGRGDYSREAITLNISVKGGRLIEGRLIIRENTVIRDTIYHGHKFTWLTSSPSSSRFPIWGWNIGKRDDRGDEVDLLGSVGAKQSTYLFFFYISNC